MESAFYAKVVTLVSSYTGAEKGAGIVERQLKYGPASAASFSASDLSKILNYLTAASRLYVPDKIKAGEMTDKLKAIAA